MDLSLSFLDITQKELNKLELSCAKLRPGQASYQLAFVWLAYTEAAYYVKLYDSFSVKVLDQVTKVPKLSCI